MKDSYNKGDLAKEILFAFLGGGLALTCIALPGMAYVFDLFKPQNAYDRARIKQSWQRLQKQGHVVRRIKNGKEEFVVTRVGQRQLSKYLIDGLKIKRQKKWDKKWRVLMFDIPNSKGRARREVSFQLKAMGMYAVQKSVFITPFPCKKEINFIGNHFFVQKHFVYFESTDIETGKDLLRMFDLK